MLNRREFATRIAAAALPLMAGRRLYLASRVSGIRPPSDDMMAGLPRLMEIAGVPGAGIGVVEAGKPLWERYLGVADIGSRTPIARETMFPAASLGKPVFAQAVLRLAADGQIDLDRALKSYVPAHAPADARGDKVTARHVLSHSTGFRNWRNAPEQALVPDFEPGSRFHYSGEGFYYLQRVVEKVSGRGFEQFIEERLFEPLGMRSSTYAWRADVPARLVTGHNRGTPARSPVRDFSARLLQYAESKGRPLASFTHEEIVAAMATMTPSPPALPNFIIPNAAGSLLTTVGDYSAFLARVLNPQNGTVDLSPAMRQQMVSPQTRINSVLAWGLGWGLETDRGAEYLWHWGDNGAFKNFVLAHLPTRSAVVVFTNGSNGMRIAERIVAAASGQEHAAFDWL